jgi:hypothetical protein
VAISQGRRFSSRDRLIQAASERLATPESWYGVLGLPMGLRIDSRRLVVPLAAAQSRAAKAVS